MTALTPEQREQVRAFAIERADELGELAIDRVLAERPSPPPRRLMRKAIAENHKARRGVAADLYLGALKYLERFGFDDFEGFKAAVRSGEFHDWESLK
jgi:hypothetical protein